MFEEFYGEDFAKILMGKNAFHIAFNLIAQSAGDNKVTGVFQTQEGLPLLAESKRTHVLILGDMIFRPRIILASDDLQGTGLAGLAMNGFDPKLWDNADKILSPI